MYKQLIVTLLVITTACTAEWKIPEGYIVECIDNSDCPESAECTLSDDGTARICVTDGETYCGNGVQEIGEKCDDGNQENGDYCSSNCQEETSICGDGLTGDGEACDDGSENVNGYNLIQTCLSDCSGYSTYCGDGLQNGDEACDDGNATLEGTTTENPDGNGCSSECERLGTCGDGQVQYIFEDCDDGNGPSGLPVTEACLYGQTSCYVCSDTCKAIAGETTYCGDNTIQHEEGERCDGNTLDCTALSPVFAAGTATCDACTLWDTSACVPNTVDANQMVSVPAGTFSRGCNFGQGPLQDYNCYFEEVPFHEVELNTFLIDTHEVTVSQFRACVEAGTCDAEGVGFDPTFCNYAVSDREDHPVNCIDWNDASTYCAWAQKRLPTAAEWEKAARGTDAPIYPWGYDEISCTYAVIKEAGANGSGCGANSTWSVGSKPLGASVYGAYDLMGNVWEWTADWYGSNYYCEGDNATTDGTTDFCELSSSVSPDILDNPTGPPSGTYKILKGGSWLTMNDYEQLRASFMYNEPPWYRTETLGFRCAR